MPNSALRRFVIFQRANSEKYFPLVVNHEEQTTPICVLMFDVNEPNDIS